jgi:hypothetical protein
VKEKEKDEHSLKHQKTANRRTHPRFDSSAVPALKHISRVGGYKVKLINISRGGALIESRERIPIGSSISLRLTSENTVNFIKGRIVRSSTSPRKGRAFQSGIAFNEDFTGLPVTISFSEEQN